VLAVFEFVEGGLTNLELVFNLVPGKSELDYGYRYLLVLAVEGESDACVDD